jgi:hypothetical protein
MGCPRRHLEAHQHVLSGSTIRTLGLHQRAVSGLVSEVKTWSGLQA